MRYKQTDRQTTTTTTERQHIVPKTRPNGRPKIE